MELDKLTTNVKRVADQYAKEFGVNYDGDWFLLKLQEEFGEMTQKYLVLTNRTRQKAASEAEVRAALADEIADVFSFILLFAKHLNIDLEQAVVKKWLKYLPERDQAA